MADEVRIWIAWIGVGFLVVGVLLSLPVLVRRDSMNPPKDTKKKE